MNRHSSGFPVKKSPAAPCLSKSSKPFQGAGIELHFIFVTHVTQIARILTDKRGLNEIFKAKSAIIRIHLCHLRFFAILLHKVSS